MTADKPLTTAGYQLITEYRKNLRIFLRLFEGIISQIFENIFFCVNAYRHGVEGGSSCRVKSAGAASSKCALHFPSQTIRRRQAEKS